MPNITKAVRNKKMISDIDKLIREAEKDCRPVFEQLEENEQKHMERVLHTFSSHSVAVRHFAPTTGYGYDDIGRDTLERIFADLFHAEAAIVRPHFVSGTHTLSMALFGLLLPGDHLLSATGLPYDTMQEVIGLTGKDHIGSLRELGVTYSHVDMLPGGGIDLPALKQALLDHPTTRVMLIQRSRGYAWRNTLTPKQMEEAIRLAKEINPHIFVMVDNCYGEFVCDDEPTDHGADLCAGSLIKNAGGGLAPTGGYIVGTNAAIHRIEARLTAPGIGREEGSYAASYQPFYQGLFMAPHTVCQSLKTAVLAARVFELLGMKTTPGYDAPRGDIIQAIELGSEERMVAFCKGIQSSSPVDSDAAPEPWDMPGYTSRVIMAAGTFVSGASVELSADGPIREPYAIYMQGGLTYSHGKYALKEVLLCLDRLI